MRDVSFDERCKVRRSLPDTAFADYAPGELALVRLNQLVAVGRREDDRTIRMPTDARSSVGINPKFVCHGADLCTRHEIATQRRLTLS